MPLAGFACPPSVPTAGNRNSIEHCLGKCPHPCVAVPLLLAMYEAERANHHQGAYISASMLCGASCPRQTVFERRHDFYEQPTRRYWPFRGTHAHSIIERGAAKLRGYGWLQELRMEVPLVYPDEPAPLFDDQGIFTGFFDTTKPLTIQLGGTLDAANPALREIDDFKSMADVKADMFAKGSKGGTYSKYHEDKHVLQLNIYRWLMAHTKIPADIKAEFKLKGAYYPAPTRLVIQAVAMMSIPRSGGSTEVKVSKWEKKQVDIPEIPVLPLKDIEVIIREGALKWYRWLVLGETPPVVDKTNDWLCRSCAFNGELIAGERCLPSKEREAQTHLA